jgi:hypothetical protein
MKPLKNLTLKKNFDMPEPIIADTSSLIALERINLLGGKKWK